MLRTLLVAALVLLLLAWIYGWRGVVRSKDQVAKYIDDFLQGRGDERDWDEFTSVRIRDPYLDRIRRIVSTRPPIHWPCEHCLRSCVRVLPNKRLKLTGGDRSKGTGVLCPWRGTDVVHRPFAGRRAARGFSAIR